MKHLKIALLFICILPANALLAQQKYSLTSPDKKIEVRVSISDSVYYQVFMDQKELISPSAIALSIPGQKGKPKVTKAEPSAHKSVLHPVVWQKSKEVADVYNALRLNFNNDLTLEWKAFDNGVAWRWVSKKKGNYLVQAEVANLNFNGSGKSWYPEEEQFFSHNERAYKEYTLDQLDAKKLASLPALFQVGDAKIVLTESDLFNYAGMWIRGTGKGGVRGVFPEYPKVKKVTSDRDEKVLERENYIARINGAQSFPWRILMLSREDKEILNNQMPYLLGRPSTGDYTWVKPGKVQWDWWHYNNVYEVDFKAGINNDTYKYYIDVAAKYGIEYVLLDEGWCDTRDLMKQTPGIDIASLSEYAKSKNVDLLLWTSWLVLDKQLDVALDQFEKWNIKGIKVDFMQRDDQDMVNYYEKVARAAAKRKMLVDFHGAYKPTGWARTYPNIMTSEGVLGNEISKFAGTITPGHTATLPFTRMTAGPMDFTPGGMLNVQEKQFAAAPAEPMTLGTRCNQMAMYVVFESPLQMLCDIPTHYLKEEKTMEFLRAVPAVWAKTVPLDGKVGEYVSIAREAKNGDWYLGAMTNWTARDLTADLSFLGEGDYQMHIWKDGLNADKNAKDFAMETITVNRQSKVPMKLVSGGGYVARLIKK
jgi:alpha-glucosidase